MHVSHGVTDIVLLLLLLLLLLQEAELRGKCEDAARRMWMGRWAAAAAAAKAARLKRQREDAALAASDVSMGRGRQGKRRLGVLSAAAAAELELLQLVPGEPQVRGPGGCTEGMLGMQWQCWPDACCLQQVAGFWCA
jgi:hypothetical protein